MSDRPKYSAARLRAVQERRLREERERQAALEWALRAAEEGRRRKERLARAQRVVREEAAAMERQLSAFAGAEAARFVTRELEELRERTRQAEAAVAHAVDETQAKRANKDLRRIRDDLNQLMARGEAAELAANLVREEAAVAGLKQRLAALELPRSEKFDAQGLREVKALLSRAEVALSRKALYEVEQAASGVKARLEQHQTDVEERFARWTEEKEKSEAAFAEADDRLAGLRADKVTMRWAVQDVKALEERIRTISAMIDAEQFAATRSEASAILKEAERIVAQAQESQLKEDRRQYIVNGIAQVMKQMGFVVQAGYPTLECPGVPASASIIQAQRVGGGAIAVSVPQEGEIWYDVDGFPMRVETGSDGQPANTCDEAQEQIEKMHTAMAEAFGIEMSELTWKGKDPNRIRKAAERLPDTTATPHQQSGGV